MAFLQSVANMVAAAIDRQHQVSAQHALVREKDLLMQEIHHRVKNSLQLVQTILYLQACSVEDDGERIRQNEATARIMSIVSMHERLYADRTVERVELGPYLGGLLTSICASLGDGVVPELDVGRMQLPAEHVKPTGLIAVELVTNAIKHGRAPIRVGVSETEAGLQIVVRDAGAGVPKDFDPAPREAWACG